MKLFITKLGIFAFIIISLLTTLTISNRILFKYVNPFVLDKNINILILGDSHTKYAFNDKILLNASNFSENGDSYFYSYQKVKQIVKINPQIDTVLLSFSQHNIHKCIEDRWLLNSSHMKSRLKLYLPLFGIDEYFFFTKNEPIELSLGLFNQVFFPALLQKGKNKFGGYEDLEHDILIDEIEKLKKEEKEEYDFFKESSIEKYYLHKIMDYCTSKNITLILVNPPLHKSIQDKQLELYKFYNNYFDSLIFYDFSRIEMEESYFGDVVHLSPSGATYFSEWIKNEQVLNINKARMHNIVYEK